MTQRVAVFIDYQNVYKRAREAFPYAGGAGHMRGQVRPLAVGLQLRGRNGDRELVAVHVYRGMPLKRLDEKGYSAAQRQVSAWERDGGGMVHAHTRPLNYRDPSSPREKGIDVALAVDFVAGAIRKDFDIGIIFSEDTDLHPAIEAVGGIVGPGRAELAMWRDPYRSGPRVVMSGGQTAFTHVLGAVEFNRLRDDQDYTQPTARKQRPPKQ